MTPANHKRIADLAKHFKSLAKENPNANATMYALLKAQNIMVSIMTDLHFRPEVNS